MTASASSGVTPTSFADSLLQALGDPLSPANVNALVAWEHFENGNWGNTAQYNPLNTTQAEPGYTETGAQGNIGSYTSWAQGLDATIQTLEHGGGNGYPTILASLKSGKGLAGDYADVLKWSGSPAEASSVTSGSAGTATPGGSMILPGITPPSLVAAANAAAASPSGSSSSGSSSSSSSAGGIFGPLINDAKYAGLFVLMLAIGGFLVMKGISSNGGPKLQIPTVIPIPG